MVLYDACLREFVEPAVLCQETADLATAFELLSRSQFDRLILVNKQQYPTGLVSLQRLYPCAVEFGLAGHPSTATNSELARQQLLPSLNPSIIEPLIVLSANTSIEQSLLHFHARAQPHIALIGKENEVLGLLNSSQMFKYLAASVGSPPINSGVDNEIAATAEPAVSDWPSAALSGQQQQITRLTQQLLSQKHELEMQLRSQQDTIDHLKAQQQLVPAMETAMLAKFPQLNLLSGAIGQPLPLKPLLDLLERLPLPLMLQTSSGQVLAQNSIWCTQIGELTDPRWLRQEAAALLETAQPTRSHNLQTALDGLSNLTLEALEAATAQPTDLSPSSTGGNTSGGNTSYEQVAHHAEFGPQSTGVCHLGTKPGSCICVCPLKSGQEQVLQFIRIPIGKLTHQLSQSAVTQTYQDQLMDIRWQNLSDQDAPHTFRLAALKLTPDEPLGLTSEIFGERATSISEPTTSLQVSTDNLEMLWLVVAQDITEQEQLSKELTARNADLVQLNRLKDEFLACISHELRTPLTSILGLSSLLKDQTLGAMSQRQVHYAQLIYQSGRHLMAVVNDILDLTQTETGQLELELEPVDISTVCDRAFNQAKQLQLLDINHAASEDIDLLPQFCLEIEPGLELITADELRLRQMLIHLLFNALKFTEPDQQIGLKIGFWGGWIAFTIWDTGIGIPAEKQHLIFQKFQQLENPLTRRYEGTGLGLVLTQRLARLHGGDVTFISKEGQGSQFTILLPPSPPDTSRLTSKESFNSPIDYPTSKVPLHAPASQSPGAGAKRFITASPRNQLVLIVEAVPQFIETLSDQLSGLGYRVVIARSGTEALEKARRLQPCVIFLNPVLPMLSGWDVLTLLKSNVETRQLPVVVTATKADEEQAHHSCADGLLSLPVQAEALRQSLQHLITKLEEPELPTRSSSVLTVLRLIPNQWIGTCHFLSTTELNQLLHSQHHRVLEADDLEQAELLARVWKPNVVLLDGTPLQPVAYFQEFSQHTFLASLPLVTIDQETTQAANQVPGLLVFPCLATLPTDVDTDSALLQAIQIAAGYAWKASILAIDAAMPISMPAFATQTASNEVLGNPPQATEWIQALVQYLQTAGLRGLVGRCWQEVQQQLQSQSIDLLLVCWTESTPRAETLEMLTTVQQLTTKPPILVLDHRSYQSAELKHSQELPLKLRQIATQILPPSLPMAELLNHIHQAIKAE